MSHRFIVSIYGTVCDDNTLCPNAADKSRKIFDSSYAVMQP